MNLAVVKAMQWQVGTEHLQCLNCLKSGVGLELDLGLDDDGYLFQEEET